MVCPTVSAVTPFFVARARNSTSKRFFSASLIRPVAGACKAKPTFFLLPSGDTASHCSVTAMPVLSNGEPKANSTSALCVTSGLMLAFVTRNPARAPRPHLCVILQPAVCASPAYCCENRGNSLSVTVTVTASSGTPAGTITLTMDGGTAITQPLVGGSTTFTLVSPAAGGHNLTAIYSGGTGFQGSGAAGTLAVGVPNVKLDAPARKQDKFRPAFAPRLESWPGTAGRRGAG